MGCTRYLDVKRPNRRGDTQREDTSGKWVGLFKLTHYRTLGLNEGYGGWNLLSIFVVLQT
jgi:hypothetical protein